MMINSLLRIFSLSFFVSYFIAQPEIVFAAGRGKYVVDYQKKALQSGNDYLLKAYIQGKLHAATLQPSDTSPSVPRRVFLQINGSSRFKFVNPTGDAILVKADIQIISSDPGSNNTLYLGINSDNQLGMSSDKTSRFQFHRLTGPGKISYQIIYMGAYKGPLGVDMSNCLKINYDSPLEFLVRQAPSRSLQGKGKYVVDGTGQSLQSGNDYLLTAFIEDTLHGATIRPNDVRVFLDRDTAYSRFKFVKSGGGEILVKTDIQISFYDPGWNNTLYLGMNGSQLVMSSDQSSRFQFVRQTTGDITYKIVYLGSLYKQRLGVDMSNCLIINDGSPLEFRVLQP